MLVVMDRRGAGERGPPRIYADGDGAKQNGVNQLSTRLGANQDTSLPFVGENLPELIELLGPTGVVTQRLRLIKDQVGTVELVTDASTGEVLQRIEHDEFGRVLSDSNPGLQPFGFAGGLYDAETGLVRFGARDYDPSIGRWTARDSVRLASFQLNWFSYVDSDPIQFADHSGTSKFDKFYGLPKRFWNWLHRHPDYKKKKGEPDYSKEEAEDLCREWRDLGEPGPDNKRGRREADDWDDLLELLIPFPDLWLPENMCLIMPGLCPRVA